MARLAATAWGMVAALSLVGAPALAGSLEIGPTRVQMIGPERTTTLNIRNSGTAPITVQIRPVDWSQSSGDDSYSPSTALVASPPVATLAPGEAQVIRLVVENVASAPTERSFRLILDELPPQRSEGVGVQTALRALVPVFITPSTQSRPRLSWSAARDGNNIRLTARNQGDTRERLVNTSVTIGGSNSAVRPDGYVLSGASRTWVIPAPTAAASLRVAGEGEFGAIEVDVPIGS